MTDDDETNNSLQQLFEDVVALIRDTPVTPELQISDSDKLQMYGLYKQATVGPCSGKEEPSRFQLVARTKYHAWLDCRELTKQQAMLKYVQLASSHEHWLGRACREKLTEWNLSNEKGEEESNESEESAVAPSSSSLVPQEERPPSEKTSITENETISSLKQPKPSWFYSWLERNCGIRPLIPRGRLDISYRDIAFAVWQCICCSSTMSRYCQLEQEVSQEWNVQEGTVVTGLSVRSLLDLYLRAASFPAESEIIVAPPINIPGMMQVLQHHNIKIVPVDIPTTEDGKCVVAVDVDAVKNAITSETVAILIVHPFGMICTTDEDMRALSHLAKQHNIHLLEDCAECFAGLSDASYQGSTLADVSFFSFGTIKTSTALGGGIAIVRSSKQQEQATKMNRMHHSLYKQQTAVEYLRKVLWCLVVQCLADCPLLYGILFAIVSLLGLDFDAMVSFSTKSFVSTNREHGSSDVKYLEQLRKRPATALLSVLLRRLRQSQTVVPSVTKRAEQCKYTSTVLKKMAPHVELPVALSDPANTFWLFPIQVDEPDNVSGQLLANGFDVPRGLSQLECIAKYASNQTRCDRAEELMNRVIYLPVANRAMTKGQMQRMVAAVNVATQSLPEKGGASDSTNTCIACKRFREARNRLMKPDYIGIAAFLVIVSDAVFFHCIPLSGFVFVIANTALKFYLMVKTTILLIAVTMRWTMADFYLKSSRCFARYGSLFFKERSGSNGGDLPASGIPETCNDSEPLLNLDVLKIPSRSTESIAEKGAVLLTGATGFIGRLVLRDLLLHRNPLSIPEGVVVLCRSKRGTSARDRISKLLDDPMYSFLSDTEKKDLVRVVEGDVTKRNVGLSTEATELICNELNISHVIHCAASVSFIQTLKEAATSNITSSLNLQSLTGRLKLKSARYVHISTAFVHGGLTGTREDPLSKGIHALDRYDVADLYRSMLGDEYLASVAMNELGFPNTYTFSKCICEHLLSRRNNVPTIVIRPSIVGPAVQQPYEGWAGDKPTTIVAAACLYMSYQWNLWCFGNHHVPYIPVDVVSRFILAKAFANGPDTTNGINRACDSPAAASFSSSDDGFERVSQMSDSSFSEIGDMTMPPTCSVDDNRVHSEQFTIHNLAWDSTSPVSATFTWVEYAVAVTQLGAVVGHFSRLTAYIGLFVTVRVLPGMKVRESTFEMLHQLLVQGPIDTIVSSFKLVGLRSRTIDKVAKLSSFLDLPLLFFHFMNNDFHFASDLVAPDGLMDGERYLFSCAAAAERFVSSIKARHVEEVTMPSKSCAILVGDDLSVLSLGGVIHKPISSDLLWALSQPRGGFFVRLAGWTFRKILRASSVDVTIDAQSFALKELAHSSATTHVVLAPNHRSFFDFFLISYLCFALPELQIEIPCIAAADDFERLPLIGWLASKGKAFFLRRGRGKADPSLKTTLDALREDCHEQGLCVEVFVEGSRSRDRRYLRPKTGLLRCLAESGLDLLVVPIGINYEEIPEQSSLACEVDRGQRTSLNNKGLVTWLKSAFLGKVNIGRIHIAATSPFHVDDNAEIDLNTLVKNLQSRQQEVVHVSHYHIHAASSVLGLSVDTVEEALIASGCNLWPGYESSDRCAVCREMPMQPTSLSEQWTVLLHFGHKLSPYFKASHPRWSEWLNALGSEDGVSTAQAVDSSAQNLVEALGKTFDQADEYVDAALTKLRSKGYDMPEADHVVQSILKDETTSCPILLLRASVALKLQNDEYIRSERHSRDNTLVLNLPDVNVHGGDGEDENLGLWGFRDSGFVLQTNQNGETSVTMTGDRYSICGTSLKKLIPFIENETSTRIDLLGQSSFTSSTSAPLVCDLKDADIDLLQSTFTKISMSAHDRIRHGSGQSQEDVYLIRSGAISTIRLPDAVVWPSSEDEVEKLVSVAKAKDLCLIPFGGGTNVSHALRCPPKDIEPRPILSVDMRLMDRVSWINEEDGLAHVQAGITGRALVEEMACRGYTIGHEPDSIEFSTLGGWVATKASGMKRNKYGNIEDIVKSVRVVGSEGLLWGGKNGDDPGPCGRESRGVDLMSLTLGSEGSFGIITSAVLRIWPLPECQEHESVVLSDFEHGLRFSRDVARLGPNLPPSVRLLDNEHFRLGQALQGESSIMERGLTSLWKLAHPVARSYSPDSVVCATILFEGTRQGVQSQRQAIKALAAQHGGTCVGARVGKSGYDLTFAIAYLRDFALTYNFLAESFETFAPWSKVNSIIQATKKRIQKEHRLRCLPGEPFVGSRVTQLYHEGACLYFYFCMNIRGVKNPSKVFSEIEHAARQEILDNGGSLSHHHGIGKLRSDFTKEMDSEAYRSLLASVKESVDPSNTFGVRNGALA